MGQARSDHSDRDKTARIGRLKRRLEQANGSPDEMQQIRAVLRATLDLLADEL